MNRYTKMYGWLYNTFGNNIFTIDDFRMTFPSSQPTKIIHDLIKLDFMKRVKRGKYQIMKPEDFVKRIVKENLEKDDILQKSDKKYAFTNSTAVNIWTDGYYWTDFTKGFKPIHIYILKKDIHLQNRTIIDDRSCLDTTYLNHIVVFQILESFLDIFLNEISLLLYLFE